MTKQKLFFLLKYYSLVYNKKPPEGFSLMEIMVAMAILSIAFAINLQFLLVLQIQNLEQKITTGAVSLTREILETSRATWLDNVTEKPKFRQTPVSMSPITTQEINNPGTTTFELSDARKKDFGGYKYNVIVNVCSNQDPTITNNVISNCSSDASSDIRTIIVQVKHLKLSQSGYDETTKQTKNTFTEQFVNTDRATFVSLRNNPKK